MYHLLDNYITEEFDFLIKLLSGADIPGLYGLTENEKLEKEEELDLKFLDEI
jgi:hypothetical protein